jgi:hypothetical protein
MERAPLGSAAPHASSSSSSSPSSSSADASVAALLGSLPRLTSLDLASAENRLDALRWDFVTESSTQPADLADAAVASHKRLIADGARAHGMPPSSSPSSAAAAGTKGLPRVVDSVEWWRERGRAGVLNVSGKQRGANRSGLSSPTAGDGGTSPLESSDGSADELIPAPGAHLLAALHHLPEMHWMRVGSGSASPRKGARSARCVRS